MAEFELIDRIKARLSGSHPETILGIGDDCALVSLALDEELALCVDTLVSGVHFAHSAAPADIGYKSLAVNLSDLAAMGALPRWATLALTIERYDPEWVDQFVQGFSDAARPWQVELIGGDTARGPLTVSVQAMGVLPKQTGLRRAGARVGDAIVVTGTLGDAALALQLQRMNTEATSPFLMDRLNRPEPRVAAGLALRELAHSAIDLSDGLIADLQHILKASAVGACLQADRLPMSTEFERCSAAADRFRLQATGGDDYELCVTVAQDNLPAALRVLAEQGCPGAVIGEVTVETDLNVLDRSGKAISVNQSGYQHF